ncbi:putative colanic acid biosynthesis acetyltransferase [Glaciecola siphonariae]|uniref:Colanic acid biosynthesis acetyltransferase n=1 Tax=Glaciecola siphonariae TaxID=521012 RepID=A0ABV9LWD6_9ALTE
MKTQLLQKFEMPNGFRGRNKFIVQAWWVIQSSLFTLSPQFMYSWRSFLLRLFGAEIGKGVIIRPSVRITYPWKLRIGDYSWIGDEVCLYTLGEIEIGSNTVISQKCYICTGSHEYTSEAFDIYAQKITIKDQAWLATDVFVAPGVSIGEGTVVGARSSVFNDLPEGMICIGNPAKPLRKRDSNETRTKKP